MSKIKYKFKMFAAKYLRSFDLALVSPLRYPGIGGSKKHQAQTEIIRNFFGNFSLGTILERRILLYASLTLLPKLSKKSTDQSKKYNRVEVIFNCFQY